MKGFVNTDGTASSQISAYHPESEQVLWEAMHKRAPFPGQFDP
jgi:hypothetical protein